MSERQFVDFVPTWAQTPSAHAFDDLPITGTPPTLAPRLPIRLLPYASKHSISAVTLGQVAAITQRILNYASYEVVHGIASEFADLRTAENEVFALAELTVEPFEEGSFIIPTKLSENDICINNQPFSGVQVLDRFVNAMQSIADGDAYAVSLGMIQAVEDLGKITRREASIEYFALGLQRQEPPRVLVDDAYVKLATKTKLKRRNIKTMPDTLEGVIVAIDLLKYTFSLKVDKSIVRGSYESIVAEKIANSLGESVKVHGVVQFERDQPRHIRAMVLESLE